MLKDINNGIKEPLLQQTAMLWTGPVSQYIVPSIKNPPLQCGLSSEFFDHLLLFIS